MLSNGWRSWRKSASVAAWTLLVIFLAANGKVTRAQAAAPAAPPAAQTTAAPAASALDIVGVWQGTLHIAQANRDLRIVVKLTKTSSEALQATFYSIDQGGQSITANKATFEGDVLKYSIAAAGATYEGKMSDDGKTITGTFAQGPMTLPLVLARTTPDTAWPIPEPPKTMAANADPSLEVATIKPSEPGRQGLGFTLRGTHFITINTSMNDLIAFAYALHAKQIIGAPDWFSTERFDIDGVPDTPGRPSIKQMKIMLQKLLADRCALKFHHEQKELSVYAVRVTSGGPKMSKTTAGPNDLGGFGFRGLGDLVVRNMSMAEFAIWMQGSVMDRPMVDQTGLKDKYDFTLKWTPDDSQFAQFRGALTPPPKPAGDNPNAPPSLYTAVQEQLGLKIEATKAPDDVIVIDHVDKPSPN
ncbi:MAG: TIGR03435 family protein [Terracidiphilus sp.]